MVLSFSNFVPGMYNQGFGFCEKVKEKLCPDDYQAFLKCLHIYSNGIIKRNDLQQFVCAMILGVLVFQTVFSFSSVNCSGTKESR